MIAIYLIDIQSNDNIYLGRYTRKIEATNNG
jgi:hypothetical protein